MIFVEMCGGVGTKLWPASREKLPKQYLPLLEDGSSLFQNSLGFIRHRYGDSRVLIQTNARQLGLVEAQALGFPKDQIIVESVSRNTGPAMGLLATRLVEMGMGEEPFMIMQADVLREPKEEVENFIATVEKIVQKTGALVTGGFKPKSLVLGVDYLIASPLEKDRGVFKMDRWLGRENSRQIFDYQKQGFDLFLHANHYAWTANQVLKTMALYKPEWSDRDKLLNHYGDVSSGTAEEVFAKELEKGVVVELPFAWRDFGTWSSVAEYAKEHPEMGLVDSRGNLIYPRDSFSSKEVGDRKDHAMVRVAGMPDLVIPLTEAEKVGEMVKKLREEGRTDLL